MKSLKETHSSLHKKQNLINIDEILDIQHNQFSLRVDKWTYEGSGWTINLILQHQLVISEIASCGRSSYFPLAKKKKSNERID